MKVKEGGILKFWFELEIKTKIFVVLGSQDMEFISAWG
jgi:hypothetical protein